MGGGQKVAKQGNAIAKASLEEQKRQYAEQQAEKKAKKEAAMSNAAGARNSANMAYSNTFSASTDVTGGRAGNYSLLTTDIGTLLSGDTKKNDKLG